MKNNAIAGGNPNDATNGRGAAVVLIAAMGIALIGGIVVLLQYRSTRAFEDDHLGRARQEYRDMIQFQGRLYEYWKKNSREKMYDIPRNPGDLFSFIKDAHVRSGIDEGMRDRLNPQTRKTPEGTEHSYHVSFRSDATRKLKRDHIGRFLIEVERGRPFLKAQTLRLSFSPQALDEITVADITLAYIVPEPADSTPK